MPSAVNEQTRHKPIIVILGPTAGGKTQLAIDLALRLPGQPGGECISADSMQIYRGMNIGTAKPTAQQRAAVPHHLIDVADPSDDTFSVDRWLELTNRAIADIRARNRFPIIVGGTNLYAQAFLEGMFEGPAPDLSRRAKLNELDSAQLRQQLIAADPLAAQRIHTNDRKRTIRAIEVFEQTGKPLSEWQTQWGRVYESANAPSPRDDVFIVGLEFPVEFINPRINARVRSMMQGGFVDEVRRLLESNALGRNAREAVGYSQIIDHLQGRISLDDAIEAIKIRTRRFAKHQRTWLRRFKAYPNSTWIAAAEFDAQQLADKALAATLAETSKRQNVETSR